MRKSKLFTALAAGMLVAAASGRVQAEASEVRFAQQFGLLYLPEPKVIASILEYLSAQPLSGAGARAPPLH